MHVAHGTWAPVPGRPLIMPTTCRRWSTNLNLVHVIGLSEYDDWTSTSEQVRARSYNCRGCGCSCIARLHTSICDCAPALTPTAAPCRLLQVVALPGYQCCCCLLASDSLHHCELAMLHGRLHNAHNNAEGADSCCDMSGMQLLLVPKPGH